MRNIGRIITVALVITLLFSFRCWAEVSYLDPYNGQISSQPVSRTFTGDGSYFVDFPIPTGEWQQLKLYLEAVIPENSNYAYISVDFGGEGLYGYKYWNQNSPGIHTEVMIQPLGNDGNYGGGEDGESNGGSDFFSLYSSLGGDNDGEGVTLKIVKIELVPEVIETPGTLISIQSTPETIQTDRGGNSQPVELLAIASPETSDGTTVKFLVKNQETGEVIFKKKAPVIEGQAGVIWSPEAEDVSIPSASFKITATAGDNKVKTDISAKQLDVDYLGAGSLNSSPDPLDKTGIIDTTLGFDLSSIPQTFATPDLNLAEPINPISGNFVFPELDLRLRSRLDIALLRVYNSLDKRIGIFGRGWSSTFSSFLTINETHVTFHNFDGSSLLFKKEADQFTPPAGAFLSLEYDPAKNEWSLANPHGKSFRFNGMGRLIAVSTTANFAQDSAITFVNNEKGLPVKIINPAGQWFEITYSESDLATEIADSTGRKQFYEYDDNARLVRVVDPINRVSVYEYNFKNLLTKISKPGSLTTEIKYKRGRAVRLVYPNGNKAKIKREKTQNGNKIVYSDSTGVDHVYKYTEDWSLRSYLPKIGDLKGPKREYKFDGRSLVEFIDPSGSITRFSYSKNGLVKSKTDALGQVETYKWNKAKARITGKTDALNREWQYNWNEFARITKITDPLEGIQSYKYDRFGNLIQAVDPKNRITRLKYDDSGNFLEKIIDPTAAATKFSYDQRGNVTEIKNALSQLITYKYDAIDRLKKVIYPDGQFYKFLYNAAGDLISRKDQLGRETVFAYDKMHNLVSVTRPDGLRYAFEYDSANRKISQTDTLGRITRFEYDQFSGFDGSKRLTKIIYPDESFETFEYDLNGRLTATIDPLGHRTAFEYDRLGRLLKTIDPAGSVWQAAYDAAGRKISAVDPLFRQTSYAYDLLDRPVSITYPDGTGLLQSFDELGNLVCAKDALSREYRWEYDSLNRLTKTILPDNTCEQIVYNAIGQPIKTINPLGFCKTFVYDSVGRMLERVDENNHKYQFRYDDSGRLTEIVNPMQAVSSFTYDIFNRITAYKDPCGNISHFEYDSEDRVLAFTDANGGRWQQNFDLLNRLISRSDPTGSTISFSYDLNGQRLSLVDAESRVWCWQYDELGRPVSETDPLGNRKFTGYDALGNVIWRENARGERTNYDLDAMSRLVKVSYPDQKVATFSYDAVGREVSRSGSTGKVIKTWDDLDRLTTETFSLLALADSPKTWQFSYNPAGYRVSAIDPQNKSYSYQYDPAGNLTKLQFPNHIDSLNKKYDAANRLIEVCSEGFKSFYKYDANSRLTSLTHEKKHGRDRTITSRNYGYDPVGNLVSMGCDSDGTSYYQYDSATRLVRAIYPEGKTVTYLYNASGDRIEEQVETARICGHGRKRNVGTDTEILNYCYDAAGRMISRGQEQYSYDEDGNLVKAVGQDKETDYIWSVDNKLLKVINQTECKKHHARHCHRCLGDSTAFEEYEYLPEDWRRVVRKTENRVFVSIYDQEDESHEYLVTPDFLRKQYKFGHFCWKPRLPHHVLQRKFIGGPGVDDIEAVGYLGRHLWRLKDGLGSTIALANRGGQAIALINYDAFGNFRWVNGDKKPMFCHESDLPEFLDRFNNGRSLGFQHDSKQFAQNFASSISPYLYTGRRYDSFSRQYFNRNRYYSPVFGRFISSDPIGFRGGDNLFAYANNRPTVQCDPYGLISPGDIVNLNISSTGAITMPSATALALQQGFAQYVHTLPWVLNLEALGATIIPILQGAIGTIGGAIPFVGGAAAIAGGGALFVGLTAYAISEPTLGPIGTVSLPMPGEQITTNTGTAAGVNTSSKPYMMSASSGGSNNDSSGQSGKELHHLLPKQLKDFFKRAGLDIEKFKIPLDKATHRLKPDGIHTGSQNWNKIWQQFQKANPNATKEQILNQLDMMRKMFGI